MADQVLLLNFGGPTNESEVEPFLRRLFEDPFIIRTRLPEFVRLWLARRIARKRAPKANAEYAKIGYSPINKMTEAQAMHLSRLLREKRPNARVQVINRYTAPFADEVVKSLDPAKDRLFLVTLYPHLCHSTTVSSLRDFDHAMMRRFNRLDLASTRVFSWWHHPRYLDLTFASLRASLETVLNDAGDDQVTVVFSAHGLPKRYCERGDPYVTEIFAHAQALSQRGEAWLAQYYGGRYLKRTSWQVTFQSRVGPVEWMRPYTDEMLVQLGKERGGRLIIVPISFTSDHIETLYEMDHTYRDLALKAGFRQVARVKPANDDPELALCLAELLLQHGL